MYEPARLLSHFGFTRQAWNEWKVKFISSENSICELATRDYTTGLVNKSRRPGMEQTPVE